ncbi:MAG: L-2-hydroxyglutarate oxidase [Patulibacter sp.]|nr:L-2-hydroxyglutarate oxidase [Patulibacter sp.]
MRFCVVGGGILGLATARALVRAHPGDEVIVLEKERAVATHQTGRNSGVVHAGVYYVPGSLKARLCRRGVELLKPYCLEHGLPYEEIGKVVVAVRESELAGLAELHRRSVANGVPGARMLDASELRELEPHAAGIAALHSPTTAITDYGAVARQLAADVVAGGGEVRLGTQVVRVLRDDVAGAALLLGDGSRLRADRVVVCAGLQSDLVARASGVFGGPRIVPFRGEYFALRPGRTDLVRGLIYPVPDPALPFLGIHLTRRVGGGVLVGPNAVLALGRESYRWRDLDRHDVAELIRWPGARRLIWTQRRTAITELRRSASRRRFMAEARRYVPALQAGDVARAVAGVRAQAVDDRGNLVDDFLIDDDGTVAWVRNAPSPAATSSLAIAEELLARLELAG